MSTLEGGPSRLYDLIEGRVAEDPATPIPTFNMDRELDESREQELRRLSLHAPPSVNPNSRPEMLRPSLAPIPRHSRVSVDFFDPSGVRILSRTLTRESPLLETVPSNSDQPEASSSNTAVDEDRPAEEPFDFERILGYYLQKYMTSYFIPLS